MVTLRWLPSLVLFMSLMVIGPRGLSAQAVDPPASADSDSANTQEADDAPQSEIKLVDPEHELRYRFSPGEIVRTEVVHRASVHQTVQGVSDRNESQATSIKVWIIKDVSPEGNITFVQQLESIDLWHRKQGAAAVTYNSASDSEPPPGYESAAQSVGIPLTTITMDPFGKILKRVENKPQPASMSMEIAVPLPSQPIKIGQTWSAPMEIDVQLKDTSHKKIQTRQVYKLTSVSGDVAEIAVDAQILTPINDPAVEAQLIQKLSKGTIRFDMVAGRLIGRQLDLDKHVIGFLGPGSSMHYVTRSTEKLLPASEATARRPAGGQADPVRAR